MKWILNRIGHLIAVRSQEPADPITPSDPHKADEVDSSHRVEMNFDAKRKELGVEDSLKDVPGVTTQMLVAFGEHGIKSIEDLADCATDDLDGWSESKDGKTIRHAGILDRFKMSLRRLRGNHYKRSHQSWVDKVAAVTWNAAS
jgi:predicted RecB family nuclease